MHVRCISFVIPLADVPVCSNSLLIWITFQEKGKDKWKMGIRGINIVIGQRR